MTTLRRLLLTTSLTVAASGVASADTIIGYLSTPSTQSGPTELTYSLSLPELNTASLPMGATVTGATIYFYVTESINTLTLTNTAASTETFTFIASSNPTKGATNTANGADAYATESILLFSQSASLGANGAGTCPTATPSFSCNSVSYTPPSLSANNLTKNGATAKGMAGLTGVTEVLSAADVIANYEGTGTFTLGGHTKAASTFSGGGGNISVSQATTATVAAEIDYTYSVPSSTPEPATMAMMGSGFLGLAWLLKRRTKTIKS